jgi:hypothetical protein
VASWASPAQVRIPPMRKRKVTRSLGIFEMRLLRVQMKARAAPALGTWSQQESSRCPNGSSNVRLPRIDGDASGE